MKFSVVVPFHNEEKHIVCCVKSLLNQDFDKNEYEIIFVDNSSNDKSSEIVRKYPEIILLHEKNLGSYAARNRGIKVAKGEIIAFTDGDCEVSKDWLSQIHTEMKKTKASIVLGKRHLNLNKSPFLQLIEDYENAKVQYIVEMQLQKRYFFGFTNNMAVKAELFKSVGLFLDVKRGADTEFVQRCLSLNNDSKLAFLPEMAICHLEITNMRAWLRKKTIRGESNKRIEQTSNYRNLSLKTNIEIFRYCLKKHNYTLLKSIITFLLLSIGIFFYSIGEIKGFTRQQDLGSAHDELLPK